MQSYFYKCVVKPGHSQCLCGNFTFPAGLFPDQVFPFYDDDCAVIPEPPLRLFTLPANRKEVISLNIQQTAKQIVNGGGSIPPSVSPQVRGQIQAEIDAIKKGK